MKLLPASDSDFMYFYIVLTPPNFATQVNFGGFRYSFHKKSEFMQMHISTFLNDDLLLSIHENSYRKFFCHWSVYFICYVLIG